MSLYLKIKYKLTKLFYSNETLLEKYIVDSLVLFEDVVNKIKPLNNNMEDEKSSKETLLTKHQKSFEEIKTNIDEISEKDVVIGLEQIITSVNLNIAVLDSEWDECKKLVDYRNQLSRQTIWTEVYKNPKGKKILIEFDEEVEKLEIKMKYGMEIVGRLTDLKNNIFETKEEVVHGKNNNSNN